MPDASIQKVETTFGDADPATYFWLGAARTVNFGTKIDK